MSNSRRLVSIVAPVFNEQSTLPELTQRLKAVAQQLADRHDFEFIYVDDGSRDGSLKVAIGLMDSEPRLRVIELRGNYGQTAALQAGLDEARGEIVISMDADLQHFPEDIPAFLEKIDKGYDVVCGWRHNRREGIVRRWPSRAANYLLRRISRVAVHDIGTTFRAYRTEIIRDFVLLGENHRFVPIFAKMVGAKIEEVPIENIERLHGESSYGLGRTLNVFLDLFFLYFFVRYLDRPIRIFGKIALAAFAVAVIITAGLGFVWLETGHAVVREHSGYFTVAIMFYIGAVQLILAGILAEVLSRIYFSGSNKASFKIRRVWRVGD